MQIPLENNLNILRLIFAIQVMLVHLSTHIEDFSSPSFIKHFPGVPSFFFISGFLIYTSCQRLTLKMYFFNRLVRIFPALFFATIGGFFVVLIAKDYIFIWENITLVSIWFISQITIGQAFNPSQFRDIGVGVINGSLWTITVEILFYLACPIVILIEKKIKYLVHILILISFIIYSTEPLFTKFIYRNKTFYDFLALTPLIWGWMFGIGILASKYIIVIKEKINHIGIISISLILINIYFDFPFSNISGNKLGLPYYLCLSGLILFIAFGVKCFSLNFDLSYGI